MAKLTRRNFLAGSAIAAAAAAGLAACDNIGGDPADIYAAPDAASYPIDPDGEGVEALWTAEETRDGWTRVTAEGAPELGVQDASKIIQVAGLAFKDMNGNGKLDLYEDWRQPHDVRAAALAEMMSAEEAMLLMWHGGAENAGMAAPGEQDENTAEEFGLCKQGSRAGVSRLASNIESYAADIAWINGAQAVCEDSAYGVPYLNSTDPYQLYGIPTNASLAATMDKDIWRRAGMYLSRAWRATGVRIELGPQVDVYSQPIGTRYSGSISEDPALNRDLTAAFAGGLQSTWGDDGATDDLGWGKDSVAAMLKHYVGEGAPEGGRNDHDYPGMYNVFPGDNFNAHLIPFLDGGMHLDSATEQMAAVMPCYGVAYSGDEKYGELVGTGYSKTVLGILRNAGWDGFFCTDWGIINQQTYGVEDLTEAERYAKMVGAGIDQYGGGFRPELISESIQVLTDQLGKDGADDRIRESATRIINVMMDVDLFENPYSDRAVAKDVLEDAEAAAFGLEASRKCIVMLKNKGNVISSAGIGDKPKVYIPSNVTEVAQTWSAAASTSFGLTFDEDLANEAFDVVTDDIDAADPENPTADDITRVTSEKLADCEYAIFKIKNPQCPTKGLIGGNRFGMRDGDNPYTYAPISLQYRPYDAPTAREVSIAGQILDDGTKENRSYRGVEVTCSNEADLDLIIATREVLPESAKIICIVECSNPMVFAELEPYCDVILTSFGLTLTEAYIDVITGKVEPSGLLQCQMPTSMETVEAQLEDVPRDMDCYTDSEGNVYDFCFGLNWSGKIDDGRTATYGQAPLTEPETEVVFG